MNKPEKPSINRKVEDYLLKKRIEREQDPESHYKRRHYWNMSMRENSEGDFYKIHQRAKEVSRQALIKENRILDTFSEQEKMEYNNEVDKMLIDSLKAKIKLLNNLA